ncbi:MAG: reverse transcriptase family protein [gamma proteobacterium symbiont of Lucinoma myriamae]|nr:reverse transcriptase family protein [gamma proteobacterium symbiont of Lucinoma myriamae]
MDKTEVGNYRPVSILSIISKVFERVVYDQIETYLDEKQLLYKFQSGFRTRFSTDTCLIHLTDFIKFQMDKGYFVGMVLLDLQKAFDTVDHSILLMKLEALGLSQDIVRWFRSYLSDRQQLVDVSGMFSSSAEIRCGVPQGSILGPLLFLIYVNDMSGVVSNKLLLYADDSAILVADKDVSSIETSLQKELEIISDWLIDNKLSLHLGKTESVLFGSKPRLRSKSNLSIECKGTVIEPKDNVKYLGAILEQYLTGESMVNSILQKANARLKFLYRKQKFLNLHTKKLLVTSLIQCHFDYACSFWYPGLSKMLKNRLQITQNKIIRFVLKMDPRSHIGSHEFISLGWLPVARRVDQIILNHVFKIKSGTTPDYMTEHFVPASSVHSYGTRFRENGCFSIPKVKGFGKKSFGYNGCILWNKLPNDIKEIQGFNNFKKAVKAYFLDLQT